MPTKRGGKGSPAKPTTTYAEWKARCAVLLKRQGISPGVMRERDWRQLFTPAQRQSSPPSTCGSITTTARSWSGCASADR
jgi:hypothetical protein